MMTLDEYFTDELQPETIISIMLGDLQRIWIYARKGRLATKLVPPEVRAAFETLVGLGFTKHLIDGELAATED